MQTKELLLKLFHSAIEEVSPENLIHKHCTLEGTIFSVDEQAYDLSKYGRICVFGSGKAAYSMAQALEPMLTDFIASGLVVSPVCKESIGKITCMESDHPLPSERSIQGAKALIEEMSACHCNDLYIYLLSGGSSALIELPAKGISLDDFQEATELMLKNSLKIDEINAVRKHLSDIKGGRLGGYSQAEGIVLGISDVIGDDLYSIGSAPLYADISRYKDAIEILHSYAIFEKMPKSVRIALKEGMDGMRLETPKTPSSKIKHFLLGTNMLARKAVDRKAHELGLDVYMPDEEINSDVILASQKMLERAFSLNQKVFIFGGETTVKVTGKGKGGRNQHCVLNMLLLAQEKGLKFSFLSAGTDGIDGNSNAAGAVVDTHSLALAKTQGLDIKTYLKENDSYHFFKKLDSLVMTGPTGTNVMDIAILIKE